MEAVEDLFQKGNFKGPLAVENSHAKWVVHRGEVPTPRPGAVSCPPPLVDHLCPHVVSVQVDITCTKQVNV